MNILITGSNGYLGRNITHRLIADAHRIVTLSHPNILKPDLQTYIPSNYKPNIIIHCAANTNVDYCETHRLNSFRSNAWMTKKIVQITKFYQAKLIYLSSCGVYGNYQTAPYTETDPLRPTTVHHSHKAISERYIQASLPNDAYNICRIGWPIGGYFGLGTFLEQRLMEAKISVEKNAPMIANAEQIGSFMHVNLLVDLVAYLVDKETAINVINVSNIGYCSRYQLLLYFFSLVNLNVQLKPVNNSFFKRPAPVSLNESLSYKKIEELIPTISWQSSLKQIARDLAI